MIAKKMEYVIKAPKTLQKFFIKLKILLLKAQLYLEFADEEWCDKKNNWLIDLDIY